MFHLYIKGQFYKAYKTSAAAQGTVAKKFRKLENEDWQIVEVKA